MERCLGDGPFKAAPRSAPNHDVQHSTSTTSDPDRPDISLVMELDNSISRFTDNELVFSTKLDLHAGANSHLFQPPRTPSASGSLYQSTASIASGNESSAYTTSRKRSRQDSFLPHRIASYASDGNFWSPSASAQSSTVLTPGLMSPSPLVNTQYILAAGFDTPTATAASALERSNVYATSPDLVFRGGRGWDTGSGIVSDSYFPQASCALAREANGRPRILTGQPPRESWVKTVHSVVGVAGRLWNFCKMNAFHGFYAGGGQGFRVDPFKKTPLPDGQEAPKNSEERTSDYELHTELPSIPGYFPDEDFIPDYMSQTPTSPERPAKKSRHEEGAGDLHANWVMIGTLSASRTSSPTRVSARKVSSAHTSGWKARGKGVKRPILSPSRPLQTSCAGSPALRPDRPASFASARSPLSTPKLESPVSVEAQRHAARRRRQEMEDDAHLKRFNQQLKAMIREGREALGTKIVVEHEVDDMTDEGYAEGDYFDDIVK